MYKMIQAIVVPYKVVVVVIRVRSQGSGCTASIRLIVHPVFLKFPLSPPDVSTSNAM
jgi:hypothetical protein